MIAPFIWWFWWMMGQGYAEYPISMKEEKERYSRKPKKIIDHEDS